MQLDSPTKEAVEAIDAKHSNIFFEKFVNELECGICSEIMHDPVQIAPCMHFNCSGCLSDWYQKSYECPTCRMPM